MPDIDMMEEPLPSWETTPILIASCENEHWCEKCGKRISVGTPATKCLGTF